MATSSITTDFVISGKEAVEKFANAIDESANCQERLVNVRARELYGEELKRFIERTLEVNGRR